MANLAGDSVFTIKLTCSSSDQKQDMTTTRNEVSVVADGDCFINFDDAVTTSNRFLVKANTQYIFNSSSFRTLHYLAATGTPALYVMAWKSPSA